MSPAPKTFASGIDAATRPSPIVVTAAILVKNGLVLAARRGPGKHLEGFWEFPGGKLEDDESPQQCLERELFEEFGITARVRSFAGQNTHDYGKKVVQLLAYRVEHVSGELQLRDHDQISWLKAEDLTALNWAPADVPLVEQFLAVYRTERFYNSQSSLYCQESSGFDVSAVYDHFLSRIALGGHILDAGCGSGRDSKEFADRGYRVTAMDSSAEMARWAEKFTGIPVRVQTFSELEEDEAFDGVWACASLLHSPFEILRNSVEHLVRSLKRNGVLYMSFKEGIKNTTDERDRFFANFTVASLTNFIQQEPNLEVIDVWSSKNALRGSTQHWTNALLRKV